MNLYSFPVTCTRCGGEGVGTLQTASAAWIPGAVLLHASRRLCDEILWEKRQKSEHRPPPTTTEAA